IVVIANMESIIKLFTSSDEQKEVIVIDETDEFYLLLEERIIPERDDFTLTLYDGDVPEGKEAVRDGKYEALLVLRSDEEGLPEASYFEEQASTSMLQRTLENELTEIKTMLVTEQLGIDDETMRKMFSQISFEKVALDTTSKSDEELNQARGIVYIMLLVLYLAVIIYGQMIAMDVATEKSSRVMELLISSAPPTTHMFAKIIAIALLGFTQLVLFFVVGTTLLQTGKGEVTDE